MKIVVIGTRGIPNIMGGVETHCEELFPRIAKRGFDITIIRRSNYVHIVPLMKQDDRKLISFMFMLLVTLYLSHTQNC